MNPELTARISPEHWSRLAWFEEHQGEVSPIPGPLPDGQLLVSADRLRLGESRRDGVRLEA